MRYVNCRYCSSIGSEKICSSCSLEGEHLNLGPLYSRPTKSKPINSKQLYIKECVEAIKSLKTEEEEF